MEAKASKTVPEEKVAEEPMESDEMLSGSDSAENTDSSEKATSAEEKSDPSPMPSEPTSGIGITSRSTTSVSDAHCESAEENPECSPMPTKQTSSTEVEKSSTVGSGTSYVTQSEPVLVHEDSTGSLLESLDPVFAMVTIGRAQKPPPIPPKSATGEEQKPETQASAKPCCKPIEKLDADEDTESKSAVSATKSTPPKKSLFGNIKRFFSPPKSGKSKESHSKSLSPTDKASQPADSGTSNPEEAAVASEEEDHMKKGSEKSGVMKSIKRSISKIMVRSKSSNVDGTNLVSDEETDKNEEAPKPSEDKAEAADEKFQKPVWMENRLSLTERPSWDGTTMTDVPSTTWSGGDVFPNDSRRPSEAGENTSEEAVAGSFASSSDEQIPDIKDDSGSGEDNVKKNGASNADESKESAVAVNDPEKATNADESKNTTVAESNLEKQPSSEEKE